MATRKKRICIIGAGAAGLIALRHVIAVQNFEGVAFEETNDLGGVWLYSEDVGKSSDEYQSSMYRDLRTNLPKEIMGFLDFPFLNNGEGNFPSSYVHHSEVLAYLHGFAAEFHLTDHIQFNKRVIRVKPIFLTKEDLDDAGNSNPKWHVLVHSTLDGSEEENVFDSVIVCNGHFVKPIIPEIVNIAKFQGEVLHSRDYRVPEPFAGKRVLLVGCGPSGMDICCEIAQVASEVIISSRSPPPEFTFPSNVRLTSGIKTVSSPFGFIFENDESAEEVQTVIYCTGYAYDFPFLSSDSGVRVKERGKAVTPLYRHMIHTHTPTLCFIGLQFRVCPFILFDCQSRFYVKYLQGLIQVPSSQEMNVERRKDKSLRKMNGRPPHQLEEAQWAYYEELAGAAGFQLNGGGTIPMALVKEIYDGVRRRRAEVGIFYKDDVIHIIDEGGGGILFVQQPHPQI